MSTTASPSRSATASPSGKSQRGYASRPRTRKGPPAGPARVRAATARAQPAGEPLATAAHNWLAGGKVDWSPRTLAARADTLRRLGWWLEQVAGAPPVLESVTPARVRQFLVYVRDGQPGGRWGSDHHSAGRAARPSTVQTYHRHLRAFVNFCLAEGLYRESPLKNVRAPRVPKDRVKPFTEEQIPALLRAARAGVAPERDTAILLLLLDTGLRVSELCSLRIGSINRGAGELTVIGKGNKSRALYMGVRSRRALWRYLETGRRDAAPEEALFASVGGNHSGGPLTPSGVRQVFRGLGAAAPVPGVRCSPHTARHTFAVNFLRGGGNLFELQDLMGHEDIQVLRRYVELAGVDLETAHRKASPVDRLKL